MNSFSIMNAPLFIIGTPRSGTTLLRLMLNNHKNIVVPPECSFAVWWYEKYKDWNKDFIRDKNKINSFIHDLRSSKKIENWNINYNDLKENILSKKPESYSELVSTIYEFYGIFSGRVFNRWGDKNNYYLHHINTIKKLFPGAYFIHIIRDGRDVACSYKELDKKKIYSKYSPRLPKNIVDIANEWLKNITIIRKSFSELKWENVYEVKYENLVNYPKNELRKICIFLDEPYDSNMLSYYYKNNDEPKEFLQWKSKILEKPTNIHIGRYLRELTTEEMDIFNNIAKQMLKLYGYNQSE